jgi:6-phosphofructokinase
MSNELKGACIVGQSGGPTSVINSSLYGVVDTALKNPSNHEGIRR